MKDVVNQLVTVRASPRAGAGELRCEGPGCVCGERIIQPETKIKESFTNALRWGRKAVMKFAVAAAMDLRGSREGMTSRTHGNFSKVSKS